MEENFFWNQLESFGNSVALNTEAGEVISYLQLASYADDRVKCLGKEKLLVKLGFANTLESIYAYIGCLRAGHAILIVDPSSDTPDSDLTSTYKPDIFFNPDTGQLETLGDNDPSQSEIHPDLALLISTSGSSGNSKAVRLSKQNLHSNAHSIVEYLHPTTEDHALLTLPLFYCYGLSVLHSYLMAGARILVTEPVIARSDLFDVLIKYEITSFACVPYSFEFLEYQNFRQQKLPKLRYITQAGGRLAPESVKQYADWAQKNGKEFFVMYGQTEATSRMAYLPPDLLKEFPDFMGLPIADGAFRLVGEDGKDIDLLDTPGELIYTGPNVMMGYALSRDELALDKATLELSTGDIALCNSSGLYKIVGRKSRFSKLYGKRLNLDDVERYLQELKTPAYCVSNDKSLFIISEEDELPDFIVEKVAKRFSLSSSDIVCHMVDTYPLLPSGKIDLKGLLKVCLELYQDQPLTKRKLTSITDIFKQVFPGCAVEPSDSFSTLGGDSLNFIRTSKMIEEHIGRLPQSWERIPVAELEGMTAIKSQIPYIEVNIVLRAMAIIAVVLGHSQLFRFDGGAAFLFMLVGYSFMRFQMPQLKQTSPIYLIFSYSAVIIFAYIASVVAFSIWKHTFSLDELLMVSNFRGTFSTPLNALWFAQVLVQCMFVLGCLLLITPVRKFASSDAKRFSQVFFLVSASIGLYIESYVWDTSHLYQFVPQLYLPLLALGFLIQTSNSLADRLFANLCVVFFAIYLGGTRMVWLLFGGTVLIWLYEIPIYYDRLKRVFNFIAEGSLFIFLFHMGFMHFPQYIMGWQSPMLNFTFGIIGSLTAWYIFQKLRLGHHLLYTYNTYIRPKLLFFLRK